MKQLIVCLMMLVALIWGLSNADAAQRCTTFGVNKDLTAIPYNQDVDVAAANQLILSFDLLDADNSITLIEIEFYVKFNYQAAVTDFIPMTDITSTAGVWTLNTVTLQWSPAVDGKVFLLAVPIAYHTFRMRTVTATGAGAGDLLYHRWNVCGA